MRWKNLDGRCLASIRDSSQLINYLCLFFCTCFSDAVAPGPAKRSVYPSRDARRHHLTTGSCSTFQMVDFRQSVSCLLVIVTDVLSSCSARHEIGFQMSVQPIMRTSKLLFLAVPETSVHIFCLLIMFADGAHFQCQLRLHQYIWCHKRSVSFDPNAQQTCQELHMRRKHCVASPEDCVKGKGNYIRDKEHRTGSHSNIIV